MLKDVGLWFNNLEQECKSKISLREQKARLVKFALVGGALTIGAAALPPLAPAIANVGTALAAQAGTAMIEHAAGSALAAQAGSAMAAQAGTAMAGGIALAMAAHKQDQQWQQK